MWILQSSAIFGR